MTDPTRAALDEARELLKPFTKLTPPAAADDDTPLVLSTTNGGIIDASQQVHAGDIRAAAAFLDRQPSMRRFGSPT